MLAEKVDNPVASDAAHRASFFRQSGWLMIANIAGGLLMWMVHLLNKSVGAQEYGVFVAFLSVAMCVPAMPLQMAMTHQTAQALATNRERQLAGMIRLVWLGTFALWAVASILIFIFQSTIVSRWQIVNPAGLWVTMLAVLFSFWFPMFCGVLQGQQNFLWLGWSMMLNGVGRIAIAIVAVALLGGLAAGMMTGVLSGLLVAVAIGAWQSRSLWLAHSLPFDWRTFLKEIIPPMLGFGAFQFLFTADTMFVKSYFTAGVVGIYGSAGTLSRALMWLVGPLASVMFPKIVHSAAKSQKTDLMTLVLYGSGILAVLGAIGLSIVGPFIIKLLYDKSWVPVATSVLPWYAFAMVPLALGNVLLNNLLARSSFKVVPAMCVLAIGYAYALTRFHNSLVTVLQVMGVFNLLMFVVCAWFTWRHKNAAPVEAPSNETD